MNLNATSLWSTCVTMDELHHVGGGKEVKRIWKGDEEGQIRIPYRNTCAKGLTNSLYVNFLAYSGYSINVRILISFGISP